MKEKKDKHFIKKPIYKGGRTAFNAFIKANLKYPLDALENKIEGTVLVRYDIDYKGSVTGAKVLKGIGYGCDEEAMRVVKLLKFEIPKGPRGLRVLFHKENKIDFRLPKKLKVKTPEPTQASITYNYTPKKKEEKKKKTSRSYTYTISRG